MANAYAQPDDVFLLGFTAQAFVIRARPVPTIDVDITTGRIRMKGHGLTAADLVAFEVTSGGALPLELQGFGFAYATPLPLGFDLFQVATMAGGATPIGSFTSAGSGWAIAIDPMRRILRHLRDAFGRINRCLTAHATPLRPDPSGAYPEEVVGLNARMAARSLIPTLQFENAAFRVAADRVMAMAEADGDTNEPKPNSILGGYLAGRPIAGAFDQTDIPDNAAIGANDSTPVNWYTGTL